MLTALLSPTSRAPGPPGQLLLGNLPEARRDPLGLFVRAAQEYGDVVRFRFGPQIAHLVAGPHGVHHVLVENHKAYGKRTRGFKNVRYVLGNGLLTSEGELWKRQRRIANPAFHHKRVESFGETMVKAAAQCATRLEAQRGNVVDVAEEMQRLTLQIVGRTLLGYDPVAHAGEVSEALGFLLRLANDRTRRIFEIPPVLPTAENRRFRKARAVLDGVVFAMIDERRRKGGERHDLLSMLIEARDAETGEGMDDAQLRDEVMTIFLAGHETTANALSWTFELLGRYPQARRELHEEVRALGRLPRAGDALPFTRMVIEESMRLYPPAWLVARSVEEDDEIDGFHLSKGSIVFLCPYVTHRSPRIWDDPEGFDPRRFDGRTPPRGAYFPFGAGPRQCIGNGFAMMEAQLVLATIAQRVRFDPLPGHPVEPEPSITLRPRYGVRATIT